MRGEFASISAIHAILPVPGSDVVVWIGDDAAAVAVPGGPSGPGGSWLLLAADTVVAGVHADLSLTGLDDLGWKAMAASLSDIAAMGGDPGHALVTVAGPAATDLGRLYRGVAAASGQFGCPVVGGDLTNARDLVVTVAVTGWCEEEPVRRDGARAGDVIWVTGPLGGAAAGLRLLRDGTVGRAGVRSGHEAGHGGGRGRGPGGAPDEGAVDAHRRPVPRLDAGRAARRAGATAMIDVSDGLSADLDHLARASGVGVRLDRLPVHPAATPQEAMGGGEDFALVFCTPESAEVEVAFAALDTPIAIGRCTADPTERVLGGEPFEPTGWEHAWGSS